jgi:hypothetical protein
MDHKTLDPKSMTSDERINTMKQINRYLDTSQFPTDKCVEWQGALSSKNRPSGGYGSLKIGKKKVRASRIIHAFFISPIPEGMHVLHSCDNPRCCNPAHLHLGTPQDNTQEAVKRGRMAKGQYNGRSKLTNENAVYIREVITDIEKGKAGRIANALAILYDVSLRTIYNVASRTTYKQAI